MVVVVPLVARCFSKLNHLSGGISSSTFTDFPFKLKPHSFDDAGPLLPPYSVNLLGCTPMAVSIMLLVFAVSLIDI